MWGSMGEIGDLPRCKADPALGIRANAPNTPHCINKADFHPLQLLIQEGLIFGFLALLCFTNALFFFTDSRKRPE